jgi:ZIP family zinc transporter
MNRVATAISPARSSLRLLWIGLPFAALAIAAAWIIAVNPLQDLSNGAPPVEKLTFERVVLDTSGIRLLVRAGGSEPMKIAQVQVDGAYWQFIQDPPGEIARTSTAWVNLPFPWVLGETHKVNVVTNSGATFEHEIPVAVSTPTATFGQLKLQGLVGIIVGVLPVAIGLLFYPAMRGVGQSGMNFLLALTIGLLAFLLIDTVEESFELVRNAAAIFQGPVMVVLAGLASFVTLMAIGRRRGTPTGLALATYIALGIGLHNLGEGLAIGAAFAAGSASLGTFLILGFTLHNVTEGIGIAAPILKVRPPLPAFVGLALLAGGPAVLGMWLGSLAYAPQWSALALAIGAGAILQVIVEVGAYIMRSNQKGLEAWFTLPVMGGLAAGVAVMYATAAFVKV